MYPQYLFFGKKKESSLRCYQIFDILNWFENNVKLKICSLAHKLYDNSSAVSEMKSPIIC